MTREEFLFSASLRGIALVCIALAALMAIRGADAWGWMLAIGVALLVPVGEGWA